MLDQTPPEICAHIFNFACRDSGYTGRSLSLVSRYIHEASEPARLQSIALVGRKQILAFAALLEQTPAHLRTTRYLFINGQESEEEMEDVFDVANEGWRRAQMERNRLLAQEDALSLNNERVQELDEEIARESVRTKQYLEGFGREAADAVERILRNVAATLELLDLALGEYVAKMMLNTVSLLRLKDLTTRCCFPLHPTGIPVLEPCHSLRYLHIVEVGDQWAWTTRFFEDGISHFAPSLTHLRLSQLEQDDSLINDLEQALGLVVPGPRATISPLPPTLELVLIKLDVAPPPHEGCSCCDDTIVYYDLLKNTRRLRDKGDHRVIVLEVDASPAEEDVYFREWSEKADGAPCRWDTSRTDLIPLEPDA
ncbi:hypothetical protein DFH07DRAFT_949546 [Mycena maculata]|uniref:Uncharacterized protein n=1 Tax=Mycena maculata TaxID=230809 RepID=A0AAD7NZW3_9AGAR|nr:hypothetical protein DFH07DRAFT_949546 [Mycena maculata]